MAQRRNSRDGSSQELENRRDKAHGVTAACCNRSVGRRDVIGSGHVQFLYNVLYICKTLKHEEVLEGGDSIRT
jgi:hypothetical protein